MKKTFLLAAAAMMIAANVGAQTGYDDTKHEVAIRYGVLPNSKIFHNNVDYENETYSGSFSAEYFYHAKECLALVVYLHTESGRLIILNMIISRERTRKRPITTPLCLLLSLTIFARRISECIQRLHLVCQNLQRQIHIQMVLHINSLQNMTSTFRLLFSV